MIQRQKLSVWLASVVIISLVVGCNHDEQAPNSPSVGVIQDQWRGQWNGPEGTFLRIPGAKGEYQIIIQNLDGPRTFSGSAVDHQIHFQRDGVQESIRATNGAATGMKWLLDKSNCLTIRSGEGYCRD